MVRNLRGIVLASDGDWNEGTPPVEAAARLRLLGVPVIAVPAGAWTRLLHVELLSLDAPTFGVAGKSVRVPFTISSALAQEYPHELATLIVLGGRRRGREGSDRRWVARVIGLSGSRGRRGISRSTSRFPSIPTRSRANNSLTEADLDPRGEAAGCWSSESTRAGSDCYPRNAARDPGVEVSCACSFTRLSKVEGGNKDYIAGSWPVSTSSPGLTSSFSATWSSTTVS